MSSLAFQSAAQLGVDNATKVKGPTGETSSLGLDLRLQYSIEKHAEHAAPNILEMAYLPRSDCENSL